MPNQWNFTSATLNLIRLVFYHSIKDNERNLCQDLLTIENTNSDLKVHTLHYANKLLVRVRLSFQKLLQTRSTWRNNTKKCLRIQTTINHISILTFLCFFFTTISTSNKCLFFSEHELKKALRDTLTRAAWYGL